jgi:hypothetical protein
MFLPFRIDMYAEGLVDLLEMIWSPLLCPQEKDAKIALLKDRTVNRYLPVFENVREPVQSLGHWVQRMRGNHGWAVLEHQPHFQ